MTLVELLPALALAALLLAALMGVVKGLAQQRRALAERESPAWRQAFLEQLRWDLLHARQMRSTPTRLTLEGFAARDFATGEATHRPTRVEYYIVEAGTQTWLLRQEAHLDELTNQHQRAELVCLNATSLTVESLQTQAAGQAGVAAGAVPLAVRVQLSVQGARPYHLDEILPLR